jgi:hypothetical protein
MRTKTNPKKRTPKQPAKLYPQNRRNHKPRRTKNRETTKTIPGKESKPLHNGALFQQIKPHDQTITTLFPTII